MYILPVVLCGCETWSLILREQYGLRIFANRLLSRIFGPKRDEVIREWRRLHNKELYALYYTPDIIRVIKKTEMGKTCSKYGKEGRCIQGFIGAT